MKFRITELWTRTREVFRSTPAQTKADPNQAEIVAAVVKQSLYVDYINCASHMTINNHRKASSLDFRNIAVIAAVAFAAVAFAIVKLPNL